VSFFLAIAFMSLAVADAQADSDDRPNIIMILVDDLGYGDLSYMGAKDLKSPHVDRLASLGVRFTEFYANCPVCSPTRAALMSGCYPDMVGVPGVIRTHPENNWGHLLKEAVLLPAVLKTAGYKTSMFGKWHLGLESPNIPSDRGFDHFHGYLGDMMDDYYKHRRHGINYMRLNRDEIDPKGHATDLFTKWAVDYIGEQDSKKPYFMYLAYNAPHTPIQPPKEWFEKVKLRENGITDQRAKLVALIEHMDDGIGQVLAQVEASVKNTKRSTLVIFSSDNGGQVNVGANNGTLRDGKQSVYEGGLKVPTCVTWFGSDKIRAASQSNFQALTMDLYPTICDFAGAKFDHKIDGKSIRPVLLGRKQEELRKLSFFRRREGGTRYQGKTIEALREGPWKLLQNSPFEPIELYNLADDPQEQKNLANDPKHRRKFNELSAALRKEIQRYGAIPWQKP
jgi:arylsulfatase A-like enzyme